MNNDIKEKIKRKSDKVREIAGAEVMSGLRECHHVTFPWTMTTRQATVSISLIINHLETVNIGIYRERI